VQSMRQNDADIPASTSQSPRRSDTLALVTIAGVIIVLAVSFVNMWSLNRLARSLGERVSRLEGQIAGRPAQRQGPDPTRVYAIRVDGAPTKGPETAPVTIAEFSEFQCPFCRKVNPTVTRIEEVYKGQVRIVWKHLPLSIHQHAVDAALAAEAARNQNKFWEYHDKLFANQDKLDVESLKKYANELQLDMARFEKDRLNPDTRKKVEADMAEADALGVNMTPSFFINGRFIRGAQPFETLAKVIDEELTKRNLPIPPKSPSN
jgi:protein-disulfide isomerase